MLSLPHKLMQLLHRLCEGNAVGDEANRGLHTYQYIVHMAAVSGHGHGDTIPARLVRVAHSAAH